MRLALVIVLACARLLAQSVELRGRVTDESGAVIPSATVTVRGAGLTKSMRTSGDGAYSFSGLPPGDYLVDAAAPGLVLRESVRVTLGGSLHSLDLALNVAGAKQEVTVEESGRPAVSTEASANASAVVLRGADLDSLADNPDDLAADLQALAGPSAGPNGSALFIDGFSGGQLPPKNSIREIRINQNPFSPEYDKLGYGRIEIFTKPGTEKWHADLGYNFATDKWNSRNAYAAQKAPFHLNELRETLSGPLNKRASFALNMVREWVDNGNVVNGFVLDPALAITPFTDTPLAELRRTGATPRVDWQLGATNTLSVRYAYNRDIVRNAGTGSLNLASRGYHNDALSHTVQVTETAVLGSAVNEIRLQYFRPSNVVQANQAAPAIQVLGAFNGGGNPAGRSVNTQDNVEIQNYTSVLRGSHAIRFGVRLRHTAETDDSPRNFAGTFTFAGVTQDGAGISSIEVYRRTLVGLAQGLSPLEIRNSGGGASQFAINTGVAAISGSQYDAGLFAGDDWKLKPHLTLSYGLRYEVQSHLGDHADFAPRVGLAWAPHAVSSARPKSVIRAGFGIFYDRFALANLLAARRYNGIVQQQFVISNPDFFPVVPGPGALGTALPSSIQRIDTSARAPYLVQSALGYERQLPLGTTLAVTYANSRGLHLLRSRDINAPLPESGRYPLGRPGFVALMETTGVFNQNQLLVNLNSRVNQKLSLTGSYAYGRAMSNTDGLQTFPANPYSAEGEYGPSAIDLRNRVSISGTLTAKWGLRFNPLLTANTGPPFDITAGRDIYGDTLFNARPAFSSDPLKPGVVRTSYGLFDPNPPPGSRLVPRNYGRGPGQIMLNLRVARTFTFGSSGEHAPAPASPSGAPAGGARGATASPFSLGSAGGGDAAAARRYSLTLSMQIRNLTNHNNPGPIIGNIASPLFGQANQPSGSGNGVFSESANNRRLELQMRFTF